MKSKAKAFLWEPKRRDHLLQFAKTAHTQIGSGNLPYTMLQTNFSQREFPQGRLLLQLLYLSELYWDLSLLRTCTFSGRGPGSDFSLLPHSLLFQFCSDS